MRVIKITILGILIHITTIAQIRTISGTVTDINYQPVKGVIVQCPSLNIITKTDHKGEYKLICPDTIKTIIFSKIGYRSQVAVLGNANEINVILSSSELTELSLKELLQVNVSTVTLKEQKITDAPGIVSIITQEELKALGIRTIRGALLLIPGFVPLQNDDEQIFAVRGIFATTNQKILVMRNGHSLNEANIDLPQTDYSLSIENIKKIEIIRGPGASIYGNSALAAVVNIITVDEEETKVKIGFGNYGQFNIDAVSHVKLNNNASVMVFGRYSGNSGEPFNVLVRKDSVTTFKGTYKANHYPSNYDFGFKYCLKSFTSGFSVRRHIYKTYWSADGKYTNIDSLLDNPRLSQYSLHFNFEYEPKINDYVGLHFQHFADYCQLNNSRLLTPIGGTYNNKIYPFGRIQLNEWNVFKAGLNYYATWIYSGKGQLLSGISFEQRRYLTNSWLASNTADSSNIEYSKKPFFPESNEFRGAPFFQIQHSLISWLKLDMGARYDIAQNFKETFNPRIAIIINPYKPLTLKAIYTMAFQAPGYSYRTSNADYSGSIEKLKPERLTTYQTSARYEFKKTSFIEIALYYNELNNLISRLPNRNYYANIGKMSSYGMEIESKYNTSVGSLFCNYSMLLPNTNFMDSTFKANNIYKKKFKHFPMHTLNGGFYLPVRDKINISVSGQYTSGFYGVQNIELDSRVILNTTINFINFIKYVDFSLSIYNVTNKRYKLGDPSVIPIEQPGRWFMFSLLYTMNTP